MEIKTVHYSALINLGDYNNEKVGFTAEIGEDETPEQAVEALREKVKSIAGENAEKLYRVLSEGKRQLKDLETKIAKATADWEAVSEFLKAQGIKQDVAIMPKFTGLLPEVKHESVGFEEAEFIDTRDEF